MLMVIPIKTKAADLHLSLKKTDKYNCDTELMILQTYDEDAKLDGYLRCSTSKAVCTRYDLNDIVI